VCALFQTRAKVCVVGGAGGIGQPMSMLLKSE
jgi:5,10-methylene-tetrahydrofolate dehydrogenase/methenyl tetrahydrofolate cyclohydrolase